MKYVSALIRVLDGEGGPAVVDVLKVDSFKFVRQGLIRVYSSGCESPLIVQSTIEKFGEQVNERRKEIWEAQHALDTLKIQLLSEIRDNTKPASAGDVFELVEQMKHAMYGDGPIVVNGDVTIDTPKEF